MNKKIKQKWVDALRSGDYIQGEGALYDSKKSEIEGKPVMCCLGVLEHICGTDVDIMDMQEMPASLEDDANSPKEFLTDAPDDIAMRLAVLNDGCPIQSIPQHSFIEIADYIEKNL